MVIHVLIDFFFATVAQQSSRNYHHGPSQDMGADAKFTHIFHAIFGIFLPLYIAMQKQTNIGRRRPAPHVL